MKRTVICILAVLLFLGAAGVTVYPLVSNYVNDKYQSVVLTDYAKDLEAGAIPKSRRRERRRRPTMRGFRRFAITGKL